MTTNSIIKPSYARRRVNNLGSTNHTLTSTTILKDGTSTDVTFSSGTTGGSEVMVDIVTPSFKLLQAEGSVIMNPMNIWKSNTSGGSAYASAYETDTGTTYLMSGSNYTRWKEDNYPRTYVTGKTDNGVSYDLANTIAIAKQEAIANIDSTDFRFGEDLVEIGKSLSYLRAPLASAADLLRTFEKDYARRRRRGITHVKAVADAWLSVRYGMRPIVTSMFNIHKAVNMLGSKPIRRTARGFARDEYEDNGTYTRSWGAGTGDVYNWERAENVNVRATIVYESRLLTKQLDLLGLRSKEIPSTVWAVMPYSWVVDRIVNVSRVVQGLMNLADPKLVIKGACVVVNSQKIVKKQLVDTYAPGWTVTTQGDVSVDFTDSKSRSVWAPSVSDMQPILQARIDLAFITDLASLALQRIKLGSFDTR